MHRAFSSLVSLISCMSFLACASRPGVPTQSGNFPVDGRVSSISHADLAAAIAAANADHIYAVHVIDRNHVRVDISDDLHEVGNYDKRGRHYSERFHGEPMNVLVTRAGGKWESHGFTVTTY